MVERQLFTIFLNHLSLVEQGSYKYVGGDRFSVLPVRQIFCNATFQRHHTIPGSFRCFKKLCHIGSHMQSQLPIFVLFSARINHIAAFGCVSRTNQIAALECVSSTNHISIWISYTNHSVWVLFSCKCCHTIRGPCT